MYYCHDCEVHHRHGDCDRVAEWMADPENQPRRRPRPTYYIHRTRTDDDGKQREGWVRVRGEAQSLREAQAWRDCGWNAERVATSPDVRRLVQQWERRAKGFPGEAVKS